MGVSQPADPGRARRRRRPVNRLPLNTDGMVLLADGVDLDVFASDCYALSHPHGLGGRHFREGPLPAEEIPEPDPAGRLVIAMDYVLGRCVKMCVYRDDRDRLWIRDRWPAHTDSDLVALCARHAADRARYADLLAQPGAAWVTNLEHLSPLPAA